MRQIEEKSGQHPPVSAERRLTAWPARAGLFVGAFALGLFIIHSSLSMPVAAVLCGLVFAAAVVLEVLITARIRREDPLRVVGFRVWLADRYLSKPDAPPMTSSTLLGGGEEPFAFGTLTSGNEYDEEDVIEEPAETVSGDGPLFASLPEDEVIEGTADEIDFDDE